MPVTAPDIHSERVLILDFGSQYTHLIARRVREIGVYSEIVSWNSPWSLIAERAPSAIILSGGPDTARSVNGAAPPEAIFDLGVPILGICYGMQIMALQLGGEVQSSSRREYGRARVRARGHSQLLRDIQDEYNSEGHGLLDVWMSHGDRVTTLPPGFIRIASSANSPIAGMAEEGRKLYGLQFHPEVTHTVQGLAILRRFLLDIARCQALWHTEQIIEDQMARIRGQVGGDQVLLALSGGVDSTVLAVLLQRTIPDQLHCVFVDTGLLRARESEELMEIFSGQLQLRVQNIDARARFLQALAGLDDPEAKRRAIGHEFIRVFEEQAPRDCRWLAQGTIYPDVVESAATATGQAHTIKSHHNVAGLPERLQMKLLEPLRELFKDEVRQLGQALGLDKQIIGRHPFPGPGLAVRVLGEVRMEYVTRLRQADDIFIQALREAGLYDSVSQAFALFLPIRSVGVMGDTRHYEHVIALRAVVTVDFMTAHWARLPADFLEQVANRIINEVAGISRVVYDISGKPPATIEWE